MSAAAHRAFVAIGSNIDPERNLPRALQQLRELGTVQKLATAWQTPAVGEEGQADFINSAALLLTDPSPAELKTHLAAIEDHLGRVRIPGRPCAPRPIDLDLILYDDLVGEFNGLRLPDPDLLEFAHCAIPIAELDPKFPHPETAVPLSEIANRFDAAQLNWKCRANIWERAGRESLR